MHIQASKIIFSSTTRQGIVAELYHCRELSYTIMNLCFKTNQNSLKEDLTQEMYLAILEMNQEKFNKLIETGSVYFWCVKFLNLSLKSSFSPFYYKFKKYRTQEKVIIPKSAHQESDQEQFLDFISPDSDRRSIEILEEKLQPELNQFIATLHWYDRMIWEYYYREFHSIAKLSVHTTINKSELQKVIRRTKDSIMDFIDRKQLLND